MSLRTRSLPVRILIALVACYSTWLGMMLVHELGHIVGAWLTGGRVISVSIPPLGFSQTIIHPNPYELVVVWCGPALGTLIPLLVLLIWLSANRRKAPEVLKFFTGFCAIANGAYIGLGWLRHAGDAGDMMRLGTPVSAMSIFGVACFIIGLICWHKTAALTAAYWKSDRLVDPHPP